MQRRLDDLLDRLTYEARLLPRVTPRNAVEERQRLLGCVRRGQPVHPAWRYPRVEVDAEAWRWLTEARRLALEVPLAELYAARLAELETDLRVAAALHRPASLRPLVQQRFGSGVEMVADGKGPRRLVEVALEVLEASRQASVDDQREPVDGGVAPAAEGISLVKLVQALADAVGVPVEVQVDANLGSLAAAGDGVVWVRSERVGCHRLALRLAVHEVLGHLTAAANGKQQPVRLLALGTAGSHAHQEGLAVLLEEQAGVLDNERRGILAARVVAVFALHEGADFQSTVQLLHRDLGCSVDCALTAAERAFRGGGIGRDAVYLRGWLEVRTAVESGETSVDELRNGKIGLADIVAVRHWIKAGQLVPPRYRPNLARSLRSTQSGTSPATSPPSEKASLTTLELT